MSAINELQAQLEAAVKPEQLLETYRQAKLEADKYNAVMAEVKTKLGEALGEGNKLKTDVGSVTWSKGRTTLDKKKWTAAKKENPELAELEKTHDEAKKALKTAQEEFSTMGAPSLVIKVG